MNVFTDEAVLEAVRFMAIPNEEIRAGSASVVYFDANMRLDDYLNVNMRVDPIRIPAYRIDGQGLWMSLTPMEVQSAWVPIRRAKGRVVLGGLGLGYAALMMAAKSNVEHVEVYEINDDCIALFEQLHGHREEAKKISVINEDFREIALDVRGDFVWNDIYQTMLPDDVIDDIRLFRRNPHIDEYRFWGQELCTFLHAAELGDYPEHTTSEEIELFSMHVRTEGAMLRPPVSDIEYVNDVHEALYE